MKCNLLIKASLHINEPIIIVIIILMATNTSM